MGFTEAVISGRRHNISFLRCTFQISDVFVPTYSYNGKCNIILQMPCLVRVNIVNCTNYNLFEGGIRYTTVSYGEWRHSESNIHWDQSERFYRLIACNINKYRQSIYHILSCLFKDIENALCPARRTEKDNYDPRPNYNIPVRLAQNRVTLCETHKRLVCKFSLR